MAERREFKKGEPTEVPGVFVTLLPDADTPELQKGQEMAAALLASAPDRVPSARKEFHEKLIGPQGRIEIIGWKGAVTSLTAGDEGTQQLTILWRPTLKSSGGVAFIPPAWEEKWELAQGEDVRLVLKSGDRKKGKFVGVFID